MNRQISRQINRDFNRSGPLIPWARDLRSGAAVILPNISKRDRAAIPEDLVIEEYDEKKHKGHLGCYDCDAKVTSVKKVESKAGANSSSGVPQHYTTLPNEAHWDSCETTQRREINFEGPNKTDKTKGFRVHLNSFGGKIVEALNNEFGPAASSGPYGQDGYKLRLKGPEAETLRQMETFAVNGMDDLIEFLSKKEMSRIVQSRIIHRSYNIPFTDFVLSYDPDLENGEHKKFQRFAKGANYKGYRRQPVMMEVITDRAFGGRATKAGMPIESRPIIIEPKNAGEKTVIIRPTLISRSYEMDWTFTSPGKYLVMGIATMERTERADAIEYTISIRVSDRAQVRRADLADIRAQNEKTQQVRDKRRGGSVISEPSVP